MASGCLAIVLLTSASALTPNMSVQLTDSKPTLDGTTVCNSDHPNLKLSFGKDTVHIQWKRDGVSEVSEKSVKDVDCTVDYSIGYSGSAPWIEGAVQLPDTICGEKLDFRIHVHTSFENMDFHHKVDGKDKKIFLNREMKDDIDHCGKCSCGDCHYECSSFGEVSLGNDQHRRRRRTAPTPIPSSCPCEKESGLDTTTRRRQFKSVGSEPVVAV